MTSPVKKRSIVIRNHKTSLSLEDEFWDCLKNIAELRQITLSNLVNAIYDGRGQANLSSAIRLFVLDHYRSRSAAPISPPGLTAPPRSGPHWPQV
jgi:predicted DNA-binding ribbon-helix-helix protein